MVGGRARAAVGLPQHATVFLSDPPSFHEHGNVFHATYSSGDAVFSVALTPHTLLAGIEAARRAYSEWEAGQQSACAIRKRRRG